MTTLSCLAIGNPCEYVSTGHAGLDERSVAWSRVADVITSFGGKTEVIRYFETGLLSNKDVKITYCIWRR